jgi:hypothetical protein
MYLTLLPEAIFLQALVLLRFYFLGFETLREEGEKEGMMERRKKGRKDEWTDGK